MDTPTPSPNPPVPVAAPATATDQIRALAFFVRVVLVSGILLAGTLFVFFLREAKRNRQDANAAEKYVQDYEKSVEELRVKAEKFSQEHPDFTPIYRRYFAPTNGAPGASSMPPPAMPGLR